jgi:hypothetical protein
MFLCSQCFSLEKHKEHKNIREKTANLAIVFKNVFKILCSFCFCKRNKEFRTKEKHWGTIAFHVSTFPRFHVVEGRKEAKHRKNNSKNTNTGKLKKTKQLFFASKKRGLMINFLEDLRKINN